MEPFSPRFHAQLEQIKKEAERQTLLVQQIISPETVQMLNKVAEDAYNASAPIRAVMQSQNFQAQMKVMQELSLKLSAIYARPAITIEDFDTFNGLYEVAIEVANEVAKEPENTKLTQLVANQLFSNTKTEIKKGRFIIPLELPSSMQWEDVRVTFVDSHTVFIELPTINRKITVDYMDMGLWDGRKKTPNAQWTVWRALAENNGRISWRSKQASLVVKKQKQLLSQALSSFFNIEGDPFHVYRQAKAYELKMTLVSTGGQLLSRDEVDDREWYRDQTQPVYEKPKPQYLNFET